MITAIVGHRGTGKTELLQRLGFYLRDSGFEFLDLDALIENKANKGIREIFMEHGEEYFRELERQLFLEAIQNSDRNAYIVLGAGFNLELIPDSIRVLWVKRVTDLDGRIFLDRPRLDKDLSPIEEFKQRAAPREQKYQYRYDDIYLMPEGSFESRFKAQEVEKRILLEGLDLELAVETVLPEKFHSLQRLSIYTRKLNSSQLGYLEFRDDLLSVEQMREILGLLPQQRFILSFRTQQTNFEEYLETISDLTDKASLIDWPVELGSPDLFFAKFPKEKMILSVHDSALVTFWEKFRDTGVHLKFATEISNFKDLIAGHRWQIADPHHRSFLPRSSSGQWQWYRLYQKGKQLLNFVKDAQGSAFDQPSYWQWMMTPKNFANFAAVLGSPVRHSYSPLEHSDYFCKMNMPFFAVDMGSDDFSESLNFLNELGLTHACVTSPYKEVAAKLSRTSGFKAVNTLYWNALEKFWVGTSTDLLGFQELVEGWESLTLSQQDIAIWGGGGVLEMLETVFPHARYYEARTGKNRRPDLGQIEDSPVLVIWAAPRTDQTLFPPVEWAPTMIYDLNYKEDSMGKDYAQWCGANYQSGLVMFKGQARYQRKFWEEQVLNEC